MYASRRLLSVLLACGQPETREHAPMFCYDFKQDVETDHLAAMQVKGLLDKGANSGAIDKKGISALHFACGQGRLEVVKFLWSRGVELDCEDPGKAVCFMFVCSSGAL